MTIKATFVDERTAETVLFSTLCYSEALRLREFLSLPEAGLECTEPVMLTGGASWAFFATKRPQPKGEKDDASDLEVFRRARKGQAI